MLHPYVLAENKDVAIKSLISFYKKVDFSTLTLRTINPNQNSPVYAIYFSYHKKGEHEKRTKSIFFDLENKQEPAVYDAAGEGNAVLYSGKFHVKESIIKEEVNKILSKMKLGMSKQRVIEQLGEDYHQVQNRNSADGSAEEWRYEFLKEEETVPTHVSDGEADIENLQKQLIGIQLWIGWSNDGAVQSISLYYGEGGKVYSKIIDKKWNSRERSRNARSRGNVS